MSRMLTPSISRIVAALPSTAHVRTSSSLRWRWLQPFSKDESRSVIWKVKIDESHFACEPLARIAGDRQPGLVPTSELAGGSPITERDTASEQTGTRSDSVTASTAPRKNDVTSGTPTHFHAGTGAAPAMALTQWVPAVPHHLWSQQGAASPPGTNTPARSSAASCWQQHDCGSPRVRFPRRPDRDPCG